MEIAIIALSVLLGMSIIDRGITNRRELTDRKDLERLLKARSLREYTMYTPSEDSDEEMVEDDGLIPIDEIGDYLQNKEK